MNKPPPTNQTLAQLQQLGGAEQQAKLQSDAELLSLYVHGGDRRAIEQLVKRYAGMVASVCRLTVSDAAQAEDAFQATFLVLMKSAKRIRQGASVAAWLHSVAYRTACRVRAQSRKQLSNQSSDELMKPAAPEEDPIVELARRMELEALDRELQKLPERLRAPLVEHYLLGQTASQIAERMELSVAAVEGRLRRGRRTLRTQLAKRGVSLSVLLAGAGWFQQHVQAADAVSWTDGFVDAYLQSENGGAGHVENPQVSKLVRGETSMIAAHSLKSGWAISTLLVTGVVVALTVTANGWQLGTNRSGGSLDLPAAARGEVNPQPIVAFAKPGSPPAVDATEATLGNIQFEGGGIGTDSDFVPQAAVPPDNPPVQWQRPQSEAGETPAWLAGGEASMQAIEKNRAVLATSIDFEFVETPLQEVVQWLGEQTDTQFELNTAAVEEWGIDVDQLVTVRGKGPVRELIRRVCEPLDLTYVVTESTIEITTLDDGEERRSLRFYDLSYVLPNSANTQSLVNAIQATVVPDSWTEMGGTSSISIVGSMMIVSAPDTVHQSIEILLLNISKMNPQNAAQVVVPSSNLQGGLGGGYGGGGMGGGFF